MQINCTVCPLCWAWANSIWDLKILMKKLYTWAERMNLLNQIRIMIQHTCTLFTASLDCVSIANIELNHRLVRRSWYLSLCVNLGWVSIGLMMLPRMCAISGQCYLLAFPSISMGFSIWQWQWQRRSFCLHSCWHYLEPKTALGSSFSGRIFWEVCLCYWSKITGCVKPNKKKRGPFNKQTVAKATKQQFFASHKKAV